MYRFPIFFFTLSLSFNSSAEKIYESDVKLKECLSNEANLTTAGMNRCTYQGIENWDAELNLTYKKLMDKLKPEGQKALRASQRLWIKYRDAELSFIDEMYNDERFMGSMYTTTRISDRLQVTKNRALELQAHLNSFLIGM